MYVTTELECNFNIVFLTIQACDKTLLRTETLIISNVKFNFLRNINRHNILLTFSFGTLLKANPLGIQLNNRYLWLGHPNSANHGENPHFSKKKGERLDVYFLIVNITAFLFI